ncbi:hypothetical protein [Aerosakkonema funiforme]|uniref:hypothetical protein n=1 Tax=Aerosakkonema funiforme TaxID=1246630 RepID=UPI0035B988F2
MSASSILSPRTITNSEGLAEFNALFNNQQAADDAALKLKVYWDKWAVAFDAQWFEATEINAKILTGKKLAQEVENAKIKVATAVQQALEGEQVTAPIDLPTNAVNNDEAVAAFYSIFKSQQVADKEVETLVANWDKWAIAFGGRWYAPEIFNAKVVVGRLIAKAMADARSKVTKAIMEAIEGKQISLFAESATNTEDKPLPVADNKLEKAKDRAQVFKDFMKIEINMGATADRLAFLYRGVQKSPYKEQIKDYPERLKAKPDGQTIVSYGETVVLKGSDRTVTFSSYPEVGKLPEIDPKGLDFLHGDIKEACVCVGSFVGDKIKAHWLGKNALAKGQFWSSTKILPLLNVVCKVNGNSLDTDIDNCVIRDQDRRKRDVPFYEMAWDVVSYGDRIASSNSLAAMFKRFETRPGLENWVRKITGNPNLDFRGSYGQPAFIYRPEVYDLKKGKVILAPASEGSPGENLLTAYDLTRFISMLGWHHHITAPAKLPSAQWHSLESIVRAMGTDACRYMDVAIEMLGLQNYISSPVIISKLGNGYSSSRNRYEYVYVALVQFIDELPKGEAKPVKLRTVSMVLRGASRDAVQLDARMAAEVTEILRRVVTEELA